MKRALEILGDRLLIGYDIGCAFDSTVRSTSLAQQFMLGGHRFCVPSYHAYAHNMVCQTANHPNNITGAGLEDFETQERLFSASNATAPVIRYSSKYHQRMFLDLFLQQYDREKYTNLGLMLFNNYQQALQIIKEGEPVLQSTIFSLGVSTGDLDMWQKEQAEFFATLGKVPERDLHRIAYVELLEELRDARYLGSVKRCKYDPL